MEKVGGEGPDGQGEHKLNFPYKSTSQDQPSYLRRASAGAPYVIPIEGRKLAMGGSGLLKEKLEYRACSMGSHGGPNYMLSLQQWSPKPRNWQLTHKPQILDSERAL